ncbi:MAG: hypothetical protein GY869_01800, partial [Planctomycetes bacterium]|nr:hypothetical protein [Planctomycetota bacterium]
MKIGAIITLLTGVILGVLTVALGMKNLGLLIGLGGSALSCIIVGVVLWIVAGKMGAVEQLLATGVPATAVIKGVKETGISMRNGMFIVL